ncbi:DEAD/DEAH box helicase family protein [Clostridium formicaceticum]|uniref:DEAD/DEAH box helicase n=1 Tax=Clostridium formicaceticum TaxID=1497 RepID=A0AAC9RPH3_9CLOT|nr:DEAD/DEAH box helicase family protein [Clostridium formicaceticum]AOY77399.1 DEAD/DEAH box helicase [Clostridium formicaceticum]ARE87950.1 Type-1 restriction enzyme R protein [Clostridium formicaceticum]
MATNFSFLKNISEYQLFANACIDAEDVLTTSPAMSAIGSRKAFELAVKWVYSADSTMKMPYKDNLQALVHEESFRYAVDPETWRKLQYIIKIGNIAVHTEKTISHNDAVLSLSILFEFVEWIDYCYGMEYEERKFNEKLIPEVGDNAEEAKKIQAKLSNELKTFKEKTNKLIDEKDKEIARLIAELKKKSEVITALKDEHKEEREFTPEDLSEYETRKKYIDVDLKFLGWQFSQSARKDCVEEEMTVVGMPKESGSGNGFVDYVLWGKDGTSIALIEAKRTFKDARKGTHQAWLYANCIEKMTGHRPIIFNTNGYDYYIWDDRIGPQRRVSGIFSRDDLQRLFNRRSSRKKLSEIEIDDKITDRYYQKEAIRAVCDNIERGHMRSLLVMATGTGKTRTASSLTDVLSRGGYVTNTLFLADRTALVSQAKDDFKNYLPDMSLCNLLSNKDDKNARIVFSTYPTMLNAIDSARNADGSRLFTPAHFDLIIVDESHRSIFKKYKAIFEYFDAYIVGLTATPRSDVHSSTYEFFEVEKDVPTFAYDYDTAVHKDHVLVPYHNTEVSTKFLSEGITYDDLSPEDKERYEEDFTDEDGEMRDEIPAPEINKFIFNQNTVDYVINDLMTSGLKDASGNRLGKTIIFAQNKNHAQFIVDRFNVLYPEYKGQFCKRIVCDDDYAQDLITQFKSPDKDPHIAVSVDMLDTGIDVREIVNLVFFKRVRSKIKFWQMIGRGTRIRPDLFGKGKDKEYFYIFDYLGNFEYFRENKNGIEASANTSTQASIFSKRIKLIVHMQDTAFGDEEYQTLRNTLVDEVFQQITSLTPDRIDVKMKRKYVDKYNAKDAFTCLSERDKSDLIEHIADLVSMNDKDDKAVEFDNLMYGLMLTQLEGGKSFKRFKNSTTSKTSILLKKTTIPQVKAKVPILKEVVEDEFWDTASILNFEKIRTELRDLMKFAITEGQSTVYTNLHDVELERTVCKEFEMSYDFENYKLKVNKYIEENKHNIAIHKLRNNISLNEADYKTLEKIFTGELGTKADYESNFKDTPFGLLVRRIAKMEREAAMKAFSSFINEQNLNANQIVFINKVIDYIEQNGYVENIAELTKPPFDKPQSFIKLFDPEIQKKFVHIINEVKDNATKIIS